MLKYIDRLLVVAYFKAYAVCLISLLSLYIVVDLFTNLDEFTHQHLGLLPTMQYIGSYYGHQTAIIFDRLCEPIVLLAGMFTIAWMQRNNELLPLLSAGVSTRRVVVPVLVSACFMLGLAIINQEFIIPRIAHRLALPKDDPNGDKDILTVAQVWENNYILVTGVSANRKEMIVKDFSVVIQPPLAQSLERHSQRGALHPAGTGTIPARLATHRRRIQGTGRLGQSQNP